MNYFNPLEYDRFYHIYNHANGFDNLFINKNSYYSFLARLSYYVLPVIDIYSYNLLVNHFHILIKIKSENEILENSETWAKATKHTFKLLNPRKQLSDCFNSYAKSFNRVYGRSGSLFKERFRRIEISSEAKLVKLIGYIHTNAQHHQMIKDFRDWPYSSYHEALGNEPTIIKRDELLNIFNGRQKFIEFHNAFISSTIDRKYWIE